MDNQQVSKRNFLFLSLEGTFFLTALTFIDASSVIPVFIDTYTGSIQLAGLANTLKQIFFFLPQMLIGPYIHRISNMPSFVARAFFIIRPLPLLMVPVLFGKLDPYLTVWIFLIIFIVFWTNEGLINIPWLDVFSRTIPGNKRGKLFGYQQLFGGIGGLAGGFVIKLALESRLSNPAKYSIIFGTASFLAFFSAAAMTQVKDFDRKPGTGTSNLLQYFRRLPNYLFSNREFVTLNITQAIASFTGFIVPFVILYCKDTFNLSSSSISTLVYIQILGTLAGGILWGSISHRLGNKYAVMISQMISLALHILSFSSLFFRNTYTPYALLWAMAFLAGIYMGSWLGFVNYIIDVVEEDTRTIYLVLNNIIMFPFQSLYFFAGLAAGAFGFIPLFILGIIAALASTFLSTFLKTPSRIADIKNNCR